MSDPLDRSDELERALELAAGEARAYLAGLAGDHVQPPGSLEAVVELGGELPERGEGALAALTLARNASAHRHRAAGACSGRAPRAEIDFTQTPASQWRSRRPRRLVQRTLVLVHSDCELDAADGAPNSRRR